MLAKKTVKKRRTTKKVKVVGIEKVIDALQANTGLSDVNKRSITRLSKAGKMVERQQKMVATSLDRIEKAQVAIAGAKTPGVKDKAKNRLALARSNAKEAKGNLSMAVAEQKKAERLVRGLYKAMESARIKMTREYDKYARTLEKAIDKPVRRRRTTKKKVANISPE